MKTNMAGQSRAKDIKKDIYEFIFVGPIYILFLLALIYLGASKSNILVFYLIGSFILILFLLLAVYAPFKMLKRHSQTICEVIIKNDDIHFSTFPILWIKEKKYDAKISEIIIRESIFKWYGRNTQKNGFTLTIENQDFYLVNDFFDDSQNFAIEFSSIGK